MTKTISRTLGIMKNIVYGVLIIVLCLFAFIVVLSNIDTPLKVRLYAVQSGSMEPAIHTGSVVLSKEFSEYKLGDIITYQNSEIAKTPVTHRVIKVQPSSEGTVYFSKGDANNVDDKLPIAKSQILGKVVLVVPLFGYIVQFSKTQFGFLAIVIVPATLVVYSELIKIKNEVIKLYKKKKES